MVAPVRVTVAVAAVLATFLDEPAADRYGLDLMRSTGQPSGTLYPILQRLQRAGWVTAQWEDIDPVEAGRSPRRYYRLSPDGVEAARRAVADLARQLSRRAPVANPATGSAG